MLKYTSYEMVSSYPNFDSPLFRHPVRFLGLSKNPSYVHVNLCIKNHPLPSTATQSIPQQRLVLFVLHIHTQYQIFLQSLQVNQVFMATSSRGASVEGSAGEP